MRNRAVRRHHIKRMKAKAGRLVINIWGDSENVIEKNYNYLANCSSWMCGNPRKYFGKKTIQEIILEEDKEYGF